MEIRGAVVLVTGASAGIGRATCRALDRAGARVAMAARRAERLEENAAAMRDALVLPTDLADMKAVEAMVDRTLAHFGRLDVLINNAALSVLTRADAIAPEDMRHVLDVNFTAAVVATNRALPAMRRQHGGVIINVGSPGGFLGVPFFASYAASKAALHAWTRTLQAEWAGSEIFVTEYHPGVVDTEMHDRSLAESKLAEAVRLAGRDGGPGAAMQPVSPESVAADLVECIRHPRRAAYSSPAVRYGYAVAYVDGLRRRFMSRMARSVRERTGITPFSE
jgi:NAD(P)-dependent dehydrogenase (short-subunit alcohol dehydrogenase family)